jgi:hypothetical protein
MGTDDGWPQVGAEMSDEGLRDRLRHYLFLAANGPLQHAKRIAQPAATAVPNFSGHASPSDSASGNGLCAQSAL